MDNLKNNLRETNKKEIMDSFKNISHLVTTFIFVDDQNLPFVVINNQSL